MYLGGNRRWVPLWVAPDYEFTGTINHRLLTNQNARIYYLSYFIIVYNFALTPCRGLAKSSCNSCY